MTPEQFAAWIEVIKGSMCSLILVAVGLAIAVRLIYKIIRGHLDNV